MLAGCKIYGMESSFDKFVSMIRPFQPLWNSAKVTCIAVGNPRERKSVTTRIVLREEGLPKGQPYRKITWLEPIPQVLIAEVDFSKDNANRTIFTAIEKYYVDLETDTTVDRVLLRWPLSEAVVTRVSGFSWGNPIRHDIPYPRTQFGEKRTCVALEGVGDHLYTVISDQLCLEISAKLLENPPHFDGIDDLYETLLPGIRHGASDQRVVQVVYPLPFDMEQTKDGRLALRAPRVAAEGQMGVVFNFKPVRRATTVQVGQEGAQPASDGIATEWLLEVPWQPGAEFGKASLFYAGEKVSSIDLRRWPGAGTLRAALDSYFDPGHNLLQEALFGKSEKDTKGGKAQDVFEMAVVRLMNLLGVPLVWYGKGALGRRSDAAGLVDKSEKRIVVLAECTLEKPEEKFSPLKERTQQLFEWLGGEAEILPVLFTQSDPPATVFDLAFDHGVALVGRNELNTLFAMLSATTREEDALRFLIRMNSRVVGVYTRLDGS